MDNTTLLVSTFDGYSMCWPPFCHGLSKYYPDHPELVFVTNHKAPPAGRGLALGTDGGWAKNLLAALERVSTPFLLYMQEDYWLKSAVTPQNIRDYVNLLERGQADYIRLLPVPGPDRDFPGDARLGIIEPHAAYRTSLQAALWRKDTLAALIRPDESPWDFERNSGRRSACYGDRFLCVKRRRYGLDYVFTAIVDGQWDPQARRYAQEEGIAVDFDALPRTSLPRRARRRVRKELTLAYKRLVRLRQRLRGPSRWRARARANACQKVDGS
jgi:hypothetical protein